jgi:hypothetical protein
MPTTVTAATNDAIAAAKDLPSLVTGLQATNPALAQQIEGKALLASKTPWGTLAVSAVSYLASKYGLGWDADTCTLVAGAGLVAGAYAMRYLTAAPISGWFRKAPISGAPTAP